MINIKEIKKEHPKAYELLRQFIENGLKEMQNKMAQNVGSVKIEEIPPIDDKIVEGVLYWNIRSLYDFFDANNQEIGIGFSKNGEGVTSYGYSIGDDGVELGEFKSRLEAEEAAYKEAFEFLEKTL